MHRDRGRQLPRNSIFRWCNFFLAHCQTRREVFARLHLRCLLRNNRAHHSLQPRTDFRRVQTIHATRGPLLARL